MKIQLKHDTVIATAETKDEMVFLLTLDKKPKREVREAVYTEDRPKRKYKKRMKTCDVCGKDVKGNVGLGVHKQMMHGIRGAIALKQGVPLKGTPVFGRTNHLKNFKPVKQDLLPSLPELHDMVRK